MNSVPALVKPPLTGIDWRMVVGMAWQAKGGGMAMDQAVAQRCFSLGAATLIYSSYGIRSESIQVLLSREGNT